MKPLIHIFATALLLSGCSKLSDRGFQHSTLRAHIKKGKVIRLADYTPFLWDRFYTFTPYTREEFIKKEVGNVPFPHSLNDDHCLLVFTSNSKVVAAFEELRKHADFSELAKEGGYSREEAVFSVENLGNGWRVLKSNGANKTLLPTSRNGASPTNRPEKLSLRSCLASLGGRA